MVPVLENVPIDGKNVFSQLDQNHLADFSKMIRGRGAAVIEALVHISDWYLEDKPG